MAATEKSEDPHMTTTKFENDKELKRNNQNQEDSTSWIDLDFKGKINNSPYSGCARESFMWGIATGTAMGLHRVRMGSRPTRSLNFAFGAALVVILPSYYFCVRNRDHKDKMVEIMMKANAFEPQEEMPEHVPIEDHPFLKPNDQNNKNGSNPEEARLGKVYEFFQRSKKDWEKPAPMAEDASKVFKEVSSSRDDKD